MNTINATDYDDASIKDDCSYNGWTNWETRNANLWIENDRQLSEFYAIQVGDLLGSYDPEQAAQLLAHRIRDDFQDLLPDVPNGFFNDVLWAALRDVNFREIAEYYIKEFESEA